MTIADTKHLWNAMHTCSLSMTTIVCGGCGIPFAIPDNYYQKLREKQGSFHCPNGCERQFCAKTEVQELKEKLKDKEEVITQQTIANIQLENQLDKANRKLKKVASGKCPCCDKTYKHLAAHMKNRHPDGK